MQFPISIFTYFSSHQPHPKLDTIGPAISGDWCSASYGEESEPCGKQGPALGQYKLVGAPWYKYGLCDKAPEDSPVFHLLGFWKNPTIFFILFVLSIAGLISRTRGVKHQTRAHTHCYVCMIHSPLGAGIFKGKAFILNPKVV